MLEVSPKLSDSIYESMMFLFVGNNKEQILVSISSHFLHQVDFFKEIIFEYQSYFRNSGPGHR